MTKKPHDNLLAVLHTYGVDADTASEYVTRVDSALTDQIYDTARGIAEDVAGPQDGVAVHIFVRAVFADWAEWQRISRATIGKLWDDAVEKLRADAPYTRYGKQSYARDEQAMWDLIKIAFPGDAGQLANLAAHGFAILGGPEDSTVYALARHKSYRVVQGTPGLEVIETPDIPACTTCTHRGDRVYDTSPRTYRCRKGHGHTFLDTPCDDFEVHK